MVNYRHRRSQGAQWVQVHPQCKKEKFRAEFRRKVVSAPPPRRRECTPAQRASVQVFNLRCLGNILYSWNDITTKEGRQH